MHHTKHFDNCMKAFGKGYGPVHKWLDEYAGLTYPEMAHRCVRHHLAGVEEVRFMWGDGAAEAALLHIKDDLEWAGYNRNKVPYDCYEAENYWGSIFDFINK